MILAANFKTCHTRSITSEYLENLAAYLRSSESQDEIYVFPPATALEQEKYDSITIGAQNAYPVQNGAFTGEIGYEQLEDLGIESILIGHSERREIGESSELLKKKLDFFGSKNMKIIYCIGESLEKKQEGEEAKSAFLEEQLSIIDESYANLVIAYEPIWAIGTGVVATIEEIEKVHTFLKSKTSKPILYGGSVKVDNVQEILALDCVDGVLVGSASLKIEDFCSMIDASEQVQG